MNRVIRRIICGMLIMVLLGGCMAMGENSYYAKDSGTEWYQALLQDGIMQVGNNYRLKRVIERAQAGENITVATIGGSITEGAGADIYQECWASRFFRGFAARFGTDKNVYLVNAGVGGTGSPFGLIRYQRDVVDRVKDEDGLPDLVVVEFAVNDWQEPTNHRCYESLVKTILEQPNEPTVILLFSVFKTGFNLQDEIRKIGETYDLMMVSIKDAAFGHVGKEWTEKEFFHDEYHPTSMGHAVMADCLLAAVDTAAAKDTDAADIDLNAAPAYATDFMGLKTIYGEGGYPDIILERGGFAHDDEDSYKNLPVGRVCGVNFCHKEKDGNEPLRITFTFRKLLIAWRATNDSKYGEAEILVDGNVKRTLKGTSGSWGQSEVILLWDAKEAAEHTLEIRMANGSENRRFTITAIGYAD